MSILGNLFWNLYAGVYDYAWATPLTRDVAHRIAEEIGPVSVAVELGAGTGLILQPLTDSGIATTAVDSSSSMLLRAKGRVGRIICAEASQSTLESYSFDVAICSNILHLHHAPGQLLDEALRLIRPGGQLVFVTPVDGVAASRLYGTDRRLGRSLGASIGAQCARVGISVLGLCFGVTRRSEASVISLITGFCKEHELSLEGHHVVHRTQRILRFRVI